MALAKTILLALVVGYLAIAILLWVAQERILFHPMPSAVPPLAPAGWHLDVVSYRARDGTRLAGVLLMPPSTRPPLVIYYGGNAEEVTAYAPRVQATYGDRAVLLVNYRGYGASEGEPGEKALVSDALELYDWAAALPQVDGRRIALHGRSLGSGVAVAVAAQKPATCLILTTPFDSALEVASKMYPWLPVSWLMRHPFDSTALAPRIDKPALVLIAEADNVIPRRHSERLADHWGGPVDRRRFPGFGHNDLDLHPAYNAAIREFLQQRCG
jgi:fermentation-respiration switch protein FrsA (DUF1100 family)